MSKDDVSTKLNALLGFKENPIDFSKLAKKELERLHEAVEGLAIGGGLFGQKILNKPLGDLMNMRLRDLLKDFKGGGPLGLGIIDWLVGKEERTEP